MDEAKIILGILEVIGKIALALLNGDDGPDPQRLAAILPPELRADVEHARQRRLTEKALAPVIGRKL